MKMSSLGLMAAALVLLASPVLAQTSSTLSVKDATATTRTLCETLDGNGNLTPCLQAGAATAAAQGTGNSTLSSIAASTKPVTSFGAVTVGTAFTPGLGIAAICTTAGNVVLSGSDGSSITVPVGVGFNQFGFAAASVAYPGSGAASCTFTALR